MNMTFARVPGWKRDDLCRPGWHRLALPAVFFASEASHLTALITALRVTKAMIGAKVIIFVFRHVCLFCQILRQNSSTGLLCRPCHMNLRRNCSRKPGQPDQPGSCEEVLNQLLLLPFSLPSPSPSPSSLLKLPIEMWSEAADKFSCVRKHH